MSNQTPPEPGGHGKIDTIHGGIFLSGSAGQEASGVRPMWKTGRKQSYKRAPRLFSSSFPRPVNYNVKSAIHVARSTTHVMGVRNFFDFSDKLIKDWRWKTR